MILSFASTLWHLGHEKGPELLECVPGLQNLASRALVLLAWEECNGPGTHFSGLFPFLWSSVLMPGKGSASPPTRG